MEERERMTDLRDQGTPRHVRWRNRRRNYVVARAVSAPNREYRTDDDRPCPFGWYPRGQVPVSRYLCVHTVKGVGAAGGQRARQARL